MKKHLLSSMMIAAFAFAANAQTMVTPTYFKDDMSGELVGATWTKDGKFTSVAREGGQVFSVYDSLVKQENGASIAEASLQNNIGVKFTTPMNLADSASRVVKVTIASSQSVKLYVLFWSGANTWDIWTNKSGYGNIDVAEGEQTYTIWVPKENSSFDYTAVQNIAFALNLWGWNDIAKVATPAKVGPGTFDIKSLEFGLPLSTSVNSANISSSVKTYPSIADESVNASIELAKSASVKITLSNLFGKTLSSVDAANVSEFNTQLMTRELASGTYIVSYYVNGQLSKAERIIKK